MSTIAQWMTHDPITVKPQDTVQCAARLMDDFNIGCLPVCEHGELVGMLTDRDITVRATCAGLAPATTLVAQVMSEGVRSCLHGPSPDEVLQQMAQVQIRRLPVLDDSGRVWGIVSVGDLLARQPEGVEAAPSAHLHTGRTRPARARRRRWHRCWQAPAAAPFAGHRSMSLPGHALAHPLPCGPRAASP